MNILFDFEHSVSTTPLLIDVCLAGNNGVLFKDTLNLNQSNTDLSILFDITTIEPQKLKLKVLT